MKKIIITTFSLLLFGGFISSCKKDYSCHCYKTYTRSDGSVTTDPDGIYTFKDSKPRAAERCNQQEGSGSDLGGSYTRDCEID